MGYELHELKVDGVTVGYVPFQNTADVWSEALVADRDGLKSGRLLGEMHCTNPPYAANRHDPHELVWADLYDQWDERNERPMRWLYCPTCRCAISPPHDGYVYADDYPAEWVRYVRKEAR